MFQLTPKRRARAATLGLLAFWVALPAAAELPGAVVPPQQAVVLPVAAGIGSDIPVFPRAQEVRVIEPSPADLRAMLRNAGTRDASAIRQVRAVVFRVAGPVDAAEILRWYKATEVPRSAPSPGGPAQPVAGPRVSILNAQTGMRPLLGDPGYLVVSVTPYAGRPQDVYVTVTRVEGSPAVARLLEEIAGLVARGARAERPNPWDADLAQFRLQGSEVTRDISLSGNDVPLLLQQIRASNAPLPVQQMYGAILQSAQWIRLITYSLPTTLSPEAFFRFYHERARGYAWGEAMRDASNPERPMILFSMGDDGGLVWVLSRVNPVGTPRGPGILPPVPGTTITLLVVYGKVDLKAIREAKP